MSASTRIVSVETLVTARIFFSGCAVGTTLVTTDLGYFHNWIMCVTEGCGYQIAKGFNPEVKSLCLPNRWCANYGTNAIVLQGVISIT